MSIAANTIIARSLKVLGVLGRGAPLSAPDADDGLFLLNQMVESWQINRLQVQTQGRTTKVLTVNDSTYTIGSSGNIVVARPNEILDAKVMAVGETYEIPLDILTDQRWREISDKTLTSDQPSALWYEKTFPLGIVNLYPVPTTACTLVLYLPVVLSSFADGTTNYDLLPGYELALTFNLAIHLAPLHGAVLTQEIVQIASDSLAAIKRQNISPLEMRVDDSILNSNGRKFDWRTGK